MICHILQDSKDANEGFTYFDTAWMYCEFKSEDAATG